MNFLGRCLTLELGDTVGDAWRTAALPAYRAARPRGARIARAAARRPARRRRAQVPKAVSAKVSPPTNATLEPCGSPELDAQALAADAAGSASPPGSGREQRAPLCVPSGRLGRC
mmetsp:Transcript_138126/g.440526  ORF Transcript_138126/g.440526 Transcript_138126/m.440526 type:complete len:115 (+) Transcript_138126:1563-1907(+)